VFICPSNGSCGVDVQGGGFRRMWGKQGYGLSSEPDCGMRRRLWLGPIWVLGVSSKGSMGMMALGTPEFFVSERGRVGEVGSQWATW
jgi:hypothetical protein